MLCITSLTIFTGCIDKKDGDGMVNGRTADGELPENGDAEPVPIKANKAGKPEIKDSSTTEEPEQPEEPETTPKPEKERRDRRTESREVSGSFPPEHGREPFRTLEWPFLEKWMNPMQTGYRNGSKKISRIFRRNIRL